MPGNSQNASKRATSKKGAAMGSGGKNRSSLKGRGKTLPADERPWHKGYSGTEKLPEKTARKQEKERRAAAAEGRAPKVGVPGTKDTTWGRGGGRAPGLTRTQSSRGGVRGGGPRGPRVAPGRRSNPTKEGPELLLGRNPVVDSLVKLALEQRSQARSRKDWAAADSVRDQLKNAGIQVEDTPAGPRWTVGEQH